MLSKATDPPVPRVRTVMLKKIDADLWREARVLAVRRGVPLRDLVQEALRDLLRREGHRQDT